MARNTDISLQKQVIYSVYVRAHTEEGTFLSIIPDLDRIKALGTDIIWFMPIHPIGVKGKKGRHEETLAAVEDVNNGRNLLGPFHSIEELKEAMNA